MIMIALKGSHNTGKTRTLQRIGAYFEALQKGGRKNLHNGEDQCDVYYDCAGQTVGVITYGDPGTDWDILLAQLVNHHCDIIFCACRSRGRTVDTIRSYASDDCKVYFANKRVADDIDNEETCNSADYRRLLEFAGFKPE